MDFPYDLLYPPSSSGDNLNPPEHFTEDWGYWGSGEYDPLQELVTLIDEFDTPQFAETREHGHFESLPRPQVELEDFLQPSFHPSPTTSNNQNEILGQQGQLVVPLQFLSTPQTNHEIEGLGTSVFEFPLNLVIIPPSFITPPSSPLGSPVGPPPESTFPHFLNPSILPSQHPLPSPTLSCCPSCGKGFQGRRYLLRHWKNSHTEKKKKKEHFCPTCGKGFTTPAKCRAHERTHLEEGSGGLMKCPQCYKSFTYLFDLNRHLTTHSDDKSWECSFCMKKYKRKEALAKHLKHKHS